jgi:hypothetical protein
MRSTRYGGSGEYQGRYCARWEGGGWQEIPLAAEMVPEDAVVQYRCR